MFYVENMRYYCAVQGEILLPVVFENPTDNDMPSCIDVYRPVRQNVYAILYGVVSSGKNTCQWLLAVLVEFLSAEFISLRD